METNILSEKKKKKKIMAPCQTTVTGFSCSESTEVSSEVHMYTINIHREYKMWKMFCGPKGSFSAKRPEITCNKDWPKKVHKCDFCPKEFNFKSRRDRHNTTCLQRP
jgi:hypothetical protein